MSDRSIDLRSLREQMGNSQAQMAAILGMSLSAYQELETGKSRMRPVYLLALERIGLFFAATTGRIEVASPKVRDEALKLADLIRGTG